MLKWSFRIVRRKQPDGSDWLKVCEVYWTEDGKHEWTTDGAQLSSETVEGLKWELEQIRACLDLPWLEADE